MARLQQCQEASSSDFRYNYQVFLSFRGEDTRKTFTDHLYTALVQAGLRTFRDNDEIERGKRLELELRKAIQQSRISIIVLSKNYASSKWCLDEVVMILEWSRTGGNEVLPIFYDVDPSDVRKQRGSIGEAFALHEEEFIAAETDYEIRKKWMEKLKSWRVALKEVANLTGMVLQNEADGYEAKFIQKIVRVVEDKLKRRVLHVGRHLVGLHSRAESINLWVQDNSTDVKILIICGMGGIGKTTIAKYVYNHNFRAFESSAFLASVREKSEQPNGLVHLQQHVLLNILKRKKENVYNVDEGIIKIEEATCCKRVLVVLDDVSEVKQLDALLGTREFYPGSKIIITTRYKWLLKANQVHKMHTVEKLDDRDSLELLCWHAFGQNHPVEGYEELSNRVVDRCGGLPLAHEVLGSMLSGKSIDVWRSTLQKLEAIPEAQILKQLKLSYEYLQDDHDKNLFLHIACFFVGYEKDDTVTILDKCGFYTTVGIQSLIDRCLITIDVKNILTMHQLIQEMGRQIVDQESPLEPGRRSRLWRNKDSLNVLKGKKGTKTIEGLILDLKMLKDDDLSCFNDKNGKKRRYEEFVAEPSLSNQANSLKRRYLSFLSWQSLRSPNEIELTIDGFARMENVLLLQLNYVQLTGCYESFPQSLKWLCWHGFPLKSIPMDLPMGNVVVLDLSFSKLKQVWKGIKVLGSLKILNLSHSVELAKTPNFLGLPNLEKLILEGCVELIKVCESIGSLEVLTLLNLKGCKNLRKFPNIGKLKFLETLTISGCSKIFDFLGELRNLESLKVFHADGVAINHPLPNVAGEVVLWDPFSWPWLSKPEKSVEGFWASLPRSLVTLSVRKCNLSNDSFPMDLCNLVSLQELDLSKNPLHTVPECIEGLSWLKSLKLNYCTRLHSVLVTNEEYLELAGSNLVERIKFREIEGTSVERIKYNPQTLKRRPELFFTFFSNLLEFAGRFKIVPLEEVERQVLNNLGFFNLELIRNLVVRLVYALKPFHTEMAPNQDRPIQGLHEYGIFSTFLPKGEAPSWCGELNVGSSISFIVPLSPNLQIQGLNVCGVYALSNRKETWYPPPLLTRINNKTKDLIWVYNPLFLGIPRDGEEELAWLSHWKLGNELESGDEVTVSIVSGDSFEVKECGINLVWGDQEEKKTSQNMTSDLSTAFTMTAGVYLLSNHLFYRPDRNHRTIPSWFRKAFGDSIDFEGWCTWEAID